MLAMMRMDACVDAAAPRRHRPPLLPSFCTSDHLTALYSLDTATSSRVPCCCLETTPPSAMDADALHGRARRPIDPEHSCLCHHFPEHRIEAVNTTLPSPCPFKARSATLTVAARDPSAPLARYISRPPPHHLSTPSRSPPSSSCASTTPLSNLSRSRRSEARSAAGRSKLELELQAIPGDAATTIFFPFVHYFD